MWPRNRRNRTPLPPNPVLPVMARHIILDSAGDARALVIVSEMVPEGRPIEIEAQYTDGGTLAEILVAPGTYREMMKDGSLAG